MDHAALEAAYRAGMPFATTLGVEYVELGADRAVLRLPDRVDLHNHLGGPHAGAMFTLGEAASGIVIMANFARLIAEMTPLPAHADIRYKSIARGAVTATATLPRAADDVIAEVRAEGKSAVEIPVTIATDDGTVTGEMTVRWVLKRN